MSKKYLDTKEGSLEQSVLGVWTKAAIEEDVRVDGRTKSYKEHRAKLEAARLRRENSKKSIQTEDDDPHADSAGSGGKEKYKKFFDAAMKKFGISSPAELKGDKEKEFYDYIDKNWKGDHEEGLENSPNAANSQHLCAKNVVHEEWGEGECVPTMHAIPDEDGNVAWYDVMFEHGIEKGVVISELKVTCSEAHENHKKKNGKLLKAKYHEEVEESYEFGTDEYRKHTQEITPGQEITDYQNFKVSSMKEALAKVWGLDEWISQGGSRKRVSEGDKRRKENTIKNGKSLKEKGGKTATGEKKDEIDLNPEIGEKKER